MNHFSLIFIFMWILTGFIAYGLILGTWTKEFLYMNNTKEAVIGFISGPCGLLAFSSGWNFF